MEILLFPFYVHPGELVPTECVSNVLFSFLSLSGTGSGLGTAVLNILHDDYPDVYRFVPFIFYMRRIFFHGTSCIMFCCAYFMNYEYKNSELLLNQNGGGTAYSFAILTSCVQLLRIG